MKGNFEARLSRLEEADGRKWPVLWLWLPVPGRPGLMRVAGCPHLTAPRPAGMENGGVRITFSERA